MAISSTISPSMLNTVTHSFITENDINKTRSKINGGLDHHETKVVLAFCLQNITAVCFIRNVVKIVSSLDFPFLYSHILLLFLTGRALGLSYWCSLQSTRIFLRPFLGEFYKTKPEILV